MGQSISSFENYTNQNSLLHIKEDTAGENAEDSTCRSKGTHRNRPSFNISGSNYEAKLPQNLLAEMKKKDKPSVLTPLEKINKQSQNEEYNVDTCQFQPELLTKQNLVSRPKNRD